MRAKLLFIFILFSTIVRAQDDTVTAKVYFENINQPAKAIAVSVGGNIFYTDEQGIVNIPANLVDNKSYGFKERDMKMPFIPKVFCQ